MTIGLEQSSMSETEENRFEKDSRSSSSSRKSASSAVITSSENEKNKIRLNTLENKAQVDEYDYFCKSLAVQLRNMPTELAVLCQEKLQKVMTEVRLYQCRLNT